MAGNTDIDYDFLTPEELLEHFVSGDDEAFISLVRHFGEKLLGFLSRFTGDYTLAEEIFQSVLVKIATHAKSFNHHTRLNTWIFAIARNTAIESLKSANNDQHQQLTDAAEPDNDDEIDKSILNALCRSLPPVNQITVEELGRRIAAAVTMLPETEREVFLLREDADLTMDEIAQIVNCSKETAKSRMRYAINKLRVNLKKETKLYSLLDRL